MPTPQLIAFTKVSLPYGWLGNMSPYQLEFDGRTWRTAESLFQALRFDEREIQEEIRSIKSPMSAKFCAKRNRVKMTVVPHSAQDVANMEMVLKLKLCQHEELQQEILTTGDRLIVEDVSSRPGQSARFWGAALVDGRWLGRNVLGELWMKVRQDLRQAVRGREAAASRRTSQLVRVA